jgi:gliding motility-associated-like protein
VIRQVFWTFTFTFIFTHIQAQDVFLSDSIYRQKKIFNTLKSNERPQIHECFAEKFQDSECILKQSKASGCNGFESNIGPAYNITWNKDDGSAPVINLPFTFCFFGDNYTNVYMNNNGNLSFLSPNSSFNALAFPSNINRILAAFWADLDFGECGEMHSIVNPTSAIFTWVDAGYFDDQCDKRNTFQIIITNGSDPLVSNGNVAFHFGDMNWTTGNASNGTNGFGGIPASVGANRGNNIDYFQLGFFDHIGNDYDGPAGDPDGIDWLDNKSFYFDFCNSINGNIAPIPVVSDNCNPYQLCNLGDTLELIFPFLSPENNQVTTVSYSCNTLNNIQTIYNSTGFSGEIKLSIPGDNQTIGIHELILTGTDNASPNASTNITYSIEVFDVLSVIPILPTIEYQNNCPPVLLTLSDTIFDSFQWSTGSLNATETIGNPINQNVTVKIERNGCKTLIDSTIYIPPIPFFHISGDLNYCAANPYTELEIIDSILLDSINWNLSILNPQNFFNGKLTSGYHYIEIWDSSGYCKNDTILQIIQYDSLHLESPLYSCFDFVNMHQNTGGSNLGNWNFPNFVQIEFIDSLNGLVNINQFGQYVIIYEDLFCEEKDSIELVYSDIPYFNLAIDTLCRDEVIKIELTDSLNLARVNWNFPDGSSQSIYSNNVQSGNQHYLLENIYGCKHDTLFNIPEYPLPQLLIDQHQCGLYTTINNSIGLEPGIWNWVNSSGVVYFGNEKDIQSFIKVSEYGNYNLIYTDSLCNKSDTIFIQFVPLPLGNIIDSNSCNGIYKEIFAYDEYPEYTNSIIWNTGEIGDRIISFKDGNYSISIENICGKFEDHKFIQNLNCLLEIPNVFSPNNDGVNDYYFINNLDMQFNYFEFQIIDRWGNVIQVFNHPDFKWLGSNMKGEALSDGVYFYKMTFETIQKDIKNYSGFIQLVR